MKTWPWTIRPLDGAAVPAYPDPIATPPATPSKLPGVEVPMPTLPDEFQIPEPGNQAAFATVRYVVEAFVIVPFVDQKLVIVPLVVEAFLKMELPETVKSPPR